MTPVRPLRHHLVDIAVLGSLLALALVGLSSAYAGWGFAVAGGLGVAVGLAAGSVAAWRRWPPLAAAALALGGYLLLGGAAVLRSTAAFGVVPTPRTLGGLATGLVTAWKDMLTLEAPIAGFEAAGLVPFILGITCATAAGYLAWHRRRAGWAVLPVAVMHLASIAFGTYLAVAPVAQAVVATAVAVGWLAWRRWHLRRNDAVDLASAQDPAARRLASRRSALSGGATLVAAALVGGAAALAVQPPGDRQVLRDDVVPPFQLEDYPSPLQSFRLYVDDHADTTLLTAEGLPPGARVRIATLDAYDGVVFGVAADGSRASGAFLRVGTEIVPDQPGVDATVRFTVGELDGVWLPDVGEMTSVEFAGPRAADLARFVFYNLDTDTAVVTAGLMPGDEYEMRVSVPARPDDAALESAGVASIAPTAIDRIPASVAPKATDIVGDAGGQFEQVLALRDHLSSNGYFSHGLDGQQPSLSGHGSARIAQLLGGDEMIGDDEQYAVAFALMAHELGIPARVVVGMYPEPEEEAPRVELTGDDVHVWVEVPFNGLGWVAFDPAPAEDDTPIDEEQEAQREPKPIVLQPPPPPEEPSKLPPSVPSDDPLIAPAPLDAARVLGLVLAVLAGALALFLLAAPVLVVLLLKRQRRLRRLRARVLADRFSGGWDEFADGVQDRGLPLAWGATRSENARRVARRFADTGAPELAAAADEGVWRPGEPTPEEVRAFWERVDRARLVLLDGLPWWRRLLVQASLRSLGGQRASRARRVVGKLTRGKVEDEALAR